MSKDFAVFKWFRAICEWGMLTISGENMIHDFLTIYVLLYLQSWFTFEYSIGRVSASDEEPT